MGFFVRRAVLTDCDAIAVLHREAFPRQQDSATWVKATLAAAPRTLAYILVEGQQVAGYSFWTQKAGIRPAAVVELEQLAVLASLRGRGLGEQLIRESLALLAAELSGNGQSIKSILVSTRADNDAQRLYARVLGARVMASIDDLYSATEVFMVVVDPDIPPPG